MRLNLRFIAVLLLAAVAAGCQALRYPASERGWVVEVMHGVSVHDPYRWLEDRSGARTRVWIEEQNALTAEVLSYYGEREALEARLEAMLRVDSLRLPMVRGQRLIYGRKRAEDDLYIYYVRDGKEGQEEVLLDPHGLSDDHTVSVRLLDVSEDGALAAYGVQRGGEDEVMVLFRTIATGLDLPDMLPRGRYFGVSIAPDKRSVYYSRHSEAGSRIYRHAMGAAVGEDELLFGQAYGPGEIVAADLSADGAHLLIHVYYGSSGDKTELHYAHLAGAGVVRALVDDIEASFDAQFAGERLVVETRWQAPNGRVLAVGLDELDKPVEQWDELIGEKERVIESVAVAGGKVVVQYLENVLSKLCVYELSGEQRGEIALEQMGSVGGIAGWWEQEEFYYGLSSFVLPYSIYRYNLGTDKKDIWAKTEVPLDSEPFVVKQVWYRSKDETKVPMFLVHRKDLELHGENPVFLTGYGGFNISCKPRFSTTAAIWVEKGGVYALPSLRGGGEFGEAWHEAGMRAAKQNTFDDFIAAAEWLIQNDYTRPEKLAISGGSNGGLLVGAALTQRPELFGAVACHVPLLDMIRYHQFMVARFWVPEYGSADVREQFGWLYAYSPYHRVIEGVSYPATIFVTGDGDTRVAPLHARKMTAMLQWASRSEHPIVLRYDTQAGHSGGMPMRKRVGDIADWLSFLMMEVEM